jgi:hypothetical protein
VVCVTIEIVREEIQNDEFPDSESVVVDEKGAIACEVKEACDGTTQDIDDGDWQSDHDDGPVKILDQENENYDEAPENIDNVGRERAHGDG